MILIHVAVKESVYAICYHNSNTRFGTLHNSYTVIPAILLSVLDECALGIHNCDPNAVCVDGFVGFLCICSPGFTGDGFMCTSKHMHVNN